MQSSSTATGPSAGSYRPSAEKERRESDKRHHYAAAASHHRAAAPGYHHGSSHASASGAAARGDPPSSRESFITRNRTSRVPLRRRVSWVIILQRCWKGICRLRAPLISAPHLQLKQLGRRAQLSSQWTPPPSFIRLGDWPPPSSRRIPRLRLHGASRARDQG